MSSQLGVVALVCVAIGLILGLVLGRKLARRGAVVRADLSLAAAAQDALYEVTRMRIAVDFNEEGSGLYTRVEEGITPRFDISELVIPYRFSVTSQGTLHSPDLSLLPESNGSIMWNGRLTERTRVTGTIVLRGDFRVSNTLPGYQLQQRFEKAFLTTREDILREYRDSAMQREYIGVAVYVPTRTLRCEVRFPASHHNLSEAPAACAFIGESEIVNVAETNRVAQGFHSESGVASLEIEHPRAGVRYAVTWMAPSASADR